MIVVTRMNFGEVLRAFRCVVDWETWALKSHESFNDQVISFMFLRDYSFDVGKEVRECLEVYRIYEKEREDLAEEERMVNTVAAKV